MLNVVTLMGRLVADPEIRTTSTNKSVANFRIAVDRGYGEDKKADFITIVAWESTANFVEKYFHKGDMIALRGEIQTRSYEDNNGNKRTAFEVVAKEVSFCGGKNDNAPTQATLTPEEAYFEEIKDDEDLPF